METQKEENNCDSQIKARRIETARSKSPSIFSRAYGAILPFCASKTTSSLLRSDKLTETGRGPFSKTSTISSYGLVPSGCVTTLATAAACARSFSNLASTVLRSTGTLRIGCVGLKMGVSRLMGGGRGAGTGAARSGAGRTGFGASTNSTASSTLRLLGASSSSGSSLMGSTTRARDRKRTPARTIWRPVPAAIPFNR